MGTSRISSDSMVAQNTISKLTGLEGSSIQNEKVQFAGSEMPCMKAGKNLTNQMLTSVGEFVGTVEAQANKIKGLAQKIEHDDQADSQNWGF
jgi:hypothetical protein